MCHSSYGSGIVNWAGTEKEETTGGGTMTGWEKGTTENYVETHLRILQPKKSASRRSRKQECSDYERNFIKQGNVDISNFVLFWAYQNQNWFKPPIN